MTGGAGFLYPFLEEGSTDTDALLADLSRSADQKAATSASLRASTVAEHEELLDAVGAAMAGRFAAGGRLFTFGNGGSATDAEGVADLFARPPHGTPLAARSLVADQAVLTALANDIGFEVVFARQLIAYGRASDVAVGISTSGNSDNVLRGFAEARTRGILTIGLAGYDGGAMATSGEVDHCFVVASDSVHRVQEAQSAVAHALWAAVQRALPAGAPVR